MLQARKLVNTSFAIATIIFVGFFTAGCSKPLYLWQADLTSTAIPPTFDVKTLANERVAILPLATYNHLQGYVPSLFQALSAACTEVRPPVKALSYYEMVNKLSAQGLSSDFVEERPDYAPSRILDRERLQRLYQGLAAQYVLQSGLAEFSESLEDRFEFLGWKLIQTRVNSLSLWLRLWNAQTGEFIWEGAAEATVASTLLEEKASLSLHDIARRLLTYMLQETLLGGKTKAVLLSEERILGGE